MTALLWIVGPFVLTGIILLSVAGGPVGIDSFARRRRWLHLGLIVLAFIALMFVIAALTS